MRFIAASKNQKDPNLLESFAVFPWAHMDLNHGPPDYLNPNDILSLDILPILILLLLDQYLFL